MKLTGLHLLLSYQCTFECDHCFVWGSPGQSGVMTGVTLGRILQEARDAATVEWIYFEGGEPFLYYAILLAGVRAAARAGFKVGVVSNAYWATCEADAVAWLKPIAGDIQDLSISDDLYHSGDRPDPRPGHALAAAGQLGIPATILSVAIPEAAEAPAAMGQLPPGQSAVMLRGRAAATLAARFAPRPWSDFTACPHEDLRTPGRVHVDPFGNLHLCQGLALGNLLRTPLRDICRDYTPEAHPIAGPLLAGGPAELVRRYELPHAAGYGDACHLCDAARRALRDRFPEILTPDQMYGVAAGT